jgi:predicted AlkP superfamily pyrophosphatase or phosphodiesterase
VLIGFDGWGANYTDRANAPNLRALAGRGVRAEAMIPSFPSKTFPNFYTLATGLYPEHHGVIANNMWDDGIGERFTQQAPTAADPRWWGGEPIWVTAERQGTRTAAMFWPGADVDAAVRPADYRKYEHTFPNEARVSQVLEWLGRPAPTRPGFVTLYFSDVDAAGHDYGPTAPETMAAAAELDRLLGVLLAGIDALGLADRAHIVVVSDHGMSQQSRDRQIFLDDYIDLSTVQIVDLAPATVLAPRTGTVDEILTALKDRHPAMAVYRREDVPDELHFSEHPRIPPVVAIAGDGWNITTRARFAELEKGPRLTGGNHGYDPRLPSMHALFVAAGPRLRHGLVVPPFENVHVYELLCRLLELTPAPNDGSPAVSQTWMAR